MKRNIVLVIIMLVLVSVIFYGKASVKKEVAGNIKQESAKLFENLDPASINSIDINNLQKNEKVSFIKNGANWEVKDKNCKADTASIERIVAELPKIRLGRKLHDWQPEFMTKYGFDKGLEINAGGKTFMIGNSQSIETPIKKDNELYLSPFREKYIFTKYNGDWCEKVEKQTPAATTEPAKESKKK